MPNGCGSVVGMKISTTTLENICSHAIIPFPGRRVPPRDTYYHHTSDIHISFNSKNNNNTKTKQTKKLEMNPNTHWQENGSINCGVFPQQNIIRCRHKWTRASQQHTALMNLRSIMLRERKKASPRRHHTLISSVILKIRATICLWKGGQSTWVIFHSSLGCRVHRS